MKSSLYILLFGLQTSLCLAQAPCDRVVYQFENSLLENQQYANLLKKNLDSCHRSLEKSQKTIKLIENKILSNSKQFPELVNSLSKYNELIGTTLVRNPHYFSQWSDQAQVQYFEENSLSEKEKLILITYSSFHINKKVWQDLIGSIYNKQVEARTHCMAFLESTTNVDTISIQTSNFIVNLYKKFSENKDSLLYKKSIQIVASNINSQEIDAHVLLTALIETKSFKKIYDNFERLEPALAKDSTAFKQAVSNLCYSCLSVKNIKNKELKSVLKVLVPIRQNNLKPFTISSKTKNLLFRYGVLDEVQVLQKTISENKKVSNSKRFSLIRSMTTIKNINKEANRISFGSTWLHKSTIDNYNELIDKLISKAQQENNKEFSIIAIEKLNKYKVRPVQL